MMDRSHRPHNVPPTADGAGRALYVGRIMVILLSVTFLLLIGRVVQLQTYADTRITQRVDSQVTTRPLIARRGAIMDRTGRMLAVTRMAYRLFIDPKLIIDHNTFSVRVGNALGYDPIDIELKMAKRPNSRYVVIDPRLTDDRLEKVRPLKLPGLSTESYAVRDYPNQTLAGQLIGFVGRDGTGLEGLERELNEYLSAEDGSIAYRRDSRGRPLWVEAAQYKPHHDGQSVRLSIDTVIQSLAEQELAAAVEKYNAKSGQMVVMNPKTGEILAMANVPTFDPNLFSETDAALRRNRAVTDMFEPGSIFKPFVWAAATELGKASPNEMINCTTSGVWRSSKGRRLRDAHGHGMLDWDHVLIKSSNIGMAIVGERLGATMMHKIVRGYGFGEPTDSGLPGEVGGLVHPLKKWTHYSVTSIPMGQEISVTPLQITAAFCAFANDGQLVSPTILAVTRQDHDRPVVRTVLSPATASHTRQVLARVVAEGTGRKAKSKLYRLFGKTGTAQLPDFKNGGYHQDRYIASFIGGGPVDSPQLVVGCFIHEPDKSIGHYGGTVAAPAVSRVIEKSLIYLGTPSSFHQSPPSPDGGAVAGAFD